MCSRHHRSSKVSKRRPRRWSTPQGAAPLLVLLLVVSSPALALPFAFTVDTDPPASFVLLGDDKAAYQSPTVFALDFPVPGVLTFLDLSIPDVPISDAEVFEFAVANPVIGTINSLGDIDTAPFEVQVIWRRDGLDEVQDHFELALMTGTAASICRGNFVTATGSPVDNGGHLGLVGVQCIRQLGDDADFRPFTLHVSGTLTEVPEPTTALLLATGLAALSLGRRRKVA